MNYTLQKWKLLNYQSNIYVLVKESRAKTNYPQTSGGQVYLGVLYGWVSYIFYEFY